MSFTIKNQLYPLISTWCKKRKNFYQKIMFNDNDQSTVNIMKDLLFGVSNIQLSVFNAPLFQRLKAHGYSGNNCVKDVTSIINAKMIQLGQKRGANGKIWWCNLKDDGDLIGKNFYTALVDKYIELF